MIISDNFGMIFNSSPLNPYGEQMHMVIYQGQKTVMVWSAVVLLKLYDEFRDVHVMLCNRRNGKKHTSVKYKSV